MTKLNLKELRQRRDKGYAVPHDDTALLLDWIERAKIELSALVDYDKCPCEIDRCPSCAVIKLLAELEES